MNNIISTFTEVRSVTKRIINIVAENSGIDSTEITLRSSINFDLGVDGDDWDDILEKTVKLTMPFQRKVTIRFGAR